MSKRNGSKYDLIRRYNQDVWSILHRSGFRKNWSGKLQTFKVFLKNIKVVDKRIKQKLVNKLERRKERRLFRRFHKKVNKDFLYRVDIVKLRPKRRKKTLHGSRLKMRNVLRGFFSQIKTSTFRKFLVQSRQSSCLMRNFFSIFESRLDVFIYRMNLMTSSFLGRQLINHKFFRINGITQNVSNYKINFFDIVTVLNVKGFFRWFVNRIRKMEHLRSIYRSFYTRRGRLIKHYKRFFFFFKRRKVYRYSSHLKKLRLNIFLKIFFINRKIKRRLEKTCFPGRIFLKSFSTKIFREINFKDVFFSVPSYLEINYRIMSIMFVEKPKSRKVFYPFKINKLKIPSLSPKF